MEQPTKPIRFSLKAVPIYVLLYANLFVLFVGCVFLLCPSLATTLPGPRWPQRWPQHGAAVVGVVVTVGLVFLVITILAIRRAKANISRGFRVLCLIALLPGPALCITFIACRFPLTVLCVGSIACLVLWLAWIRCRARAPVDASSVESHPASDANSGERPRAPAFMRSLFRVHAWTLGISLLFAPAFWLFAREPAGQENNWVVASFVVAGSVSFLACLLVPVDLLLCIDSLALRIIAGKRFSPTLRAACWSLAMAFLAVAPFAIHCAIRLLSESRTGGFNM